MQHQTRIIPLEPTNQETFLPNKRMDIIANNQPANQEPSISRKLVDNLFNQQEIKLGLGTIFFFLIGNNLIQPTSLTKQSTCVMEASKVMGHLADNCKELSQGDDKASTQAHPEIAGSQLGSVVGFHNVTGEVATNGAI